MKLSIKKPLQTLLILGGIVIFASACKPKDAAPAPENHANHDHQADGHDHAGHDHAGHDHAGHDHPHDPNAAEKGKLDPRANTELIPPIEIAEVPDGAWYCDMGTSHYYRYDKGDGKCTVCGMPLKHKEAAH